MDLPPGTMLPGDILIGGVLGDGGHGTVYYARRQHEELALKVLRFPHPEAVRRLLQEGEILETLRHPHIVPLVAILDVQGHPALLSQFAPAGSLAALIRDRLPPLAEALALFRGIVAGVAHAHAHRIIHRDLKPANILLKRDEQGLVPWVADFGVARLLDAEGHTAEPIGTRGYMAPEQLETPTDLDARVDVFALGCILYELTHGVPAFAAAQRTFAANATTQEPASTRRDELPEPVLRTIQGCLEPRRERRIGGCAGILAMLEGADAPVRNRWSARVKAHVAAPSSRGRLQRIPLAVGATALIGAAIGTAGVLAYQPEGEPPCGVPALRGLDPGTFTCLATPEGTRVSLSKRWCGRVHQVLNRAGAELQESGHPEDANAYLHGDDWLGVDCTDDGVVVVQVGGSDVVAVSDGPPR